MGRCDAVPSEEGNLQAGAGILHGAAEFFGKQGRRVLFGEKGERSAEQPGTRTGAFPFVARVTGSRRDGFAFRGGTRPEDAMKTAGNF